MKAVLCMCPHCDHIMRLSDLHLRAKGKAPITWLDKYEKKSDGIDIKEQKLEDQLDKIREEATLKGRAQVPKLIRKSMDPQIVNLKYDPYDIKAILHPIDFVVFDGMNKAKMKNVVLLSRKTKNPHLNGLQKGIAKAVENKAYDWKVVRVSNEGDVGFE